MERKVATPRGLTRFLRHCSSVSDEVTEATPVESEPAVAEINLHRTKLTIKSKSTHLIYFTTKAK